MLPLKGGILFSFPTTLLWDIGLLPIILGESNLLILLELGRTLKLILFILLVITIEPWDIGLWKFLFWFLVILLFKGA